ncbi:hypothetical protein U1Q18_020711 [Sarracenia purpurea var. burkii]
MAIGSSSLVMTASMKPGKSDARPISDGMTLGMVANRMFFGLASELRKPNHSSVTTKVTRIRWSLEASKLQRFIMGLMCPLPTGPILTHLGPKAND